MICKSCKKNIESDSMFCRYCGVKITKDRLRIPTPIKKGNSYTGQIMVNGNRHRVTGKTIKEYEAKCLAIKSELISLRDNPTSMQLGKCIDSYIESKSNILSPSTVAGYRRQRKDRFQRYMDRSINTINWQCMVNEESKLVSAKTISNALSLCRAACRAIGFGIPDVTLPQRIKTEKQFLTSEQVQVLLTACSGHRSEMAILLGLHSLRCSEILAVTKSNCHGNTIDIHGAIVERGIYKETNKTSNSRRTVTILIPRLKEMIDNAPDGYLVKLTQIQIYKDINKLCKENGLPLIGIHGLRHTFASICYEKSIPINTVMLLGGWDNPGTVNSIYTHISNEQLTKANEQLLTLYLPH